MTYCALLNEILKDHRKVENWRKITLPLLKAHLRLAKCYKYGIFIQKNELRAMNYLIFIIEHSPKDNKIKKEAFREMEDFEKIWAYYESIKQKKSK